MNTFNKTKIIGDSTLYGIQVLVQRIGTTYDMALQIKSTGVLSGVNITYKLVPINRT